MKLELKHLAPYLPYGLKMISTCDLHEDYEDIADDYSELLNKGNVFELYLITTESIDFYDGDCDDFAVKSERIRLSNAGCFKPILRPISDLTKEIEVNGEKFVPIIALYRLSNEYNYNNELDYEFIDSWGAKGNILKVFSNREKDEYIEFIYCGGSFRKDARYSKGSYHFGMYLPHAIRCDRRIYNQHKLHQKLLEWHFDVFGLIEQGLAIDINTIQS